MVFQGSILVDTMVIIVCHKRGYWTSLVGQYKVETVECCVTETQTGKQRRNPEHHIDEATLRSELSAVHNVTKEQLAEVALRGGNALDDGEKHLWAHALSRPDAWVLCGPDAASIRFGYNAKHKDRLLSLQQLLDDVGVDSQGQLQAHYTKNWLEKKISNLVLGIL